MQQVEKAAVRFGSYTMSHPWFKRQRAAGELPVLDKTKAWAGPVAAAIRTFNNLSLGVKLIATTEEKEAKVVVVLANGPTTYKGFYGETVQTGPRFKPDGLHGHSAVLLDRRNEIYFAGVFLPGKVANTTSRQKEIVVLHEFIHACGMDEHDSVGIMYDTFRARDDGLVELDQDKGGKAMPPIRVGAKTTCIMKMLWAGGDACTDD
jgi:hypothetical protein